MPAERLLLDTNALIGLGMGEPALVARVQRAAWVAIPWIVAVEFQVGADSAALQWLVQATAFIEVIDTPYTDTALTARIVGIRRGGHCKLPDAIVLAVAQACGAVLLTRDRQLLATAAQVGAEAANWRDD